MQLLLINQQRFFFSASSHSHFQKKNTNYGNFRILSMMVKNNPLKKSDGDEEEEAHKIYIFNRGFHSRHFLPKFFLWLSERRWPRFC